MSSFALLDWLTNGGPSDPKHQSWVHPLVASIIHYVLFFSLTLRAHDKLLEYYYEYLSSPSSADNDSSTLGTPSSCHVDPNLQWKRDAAAVFLFLYTVGVLVWRLFFPHQEEPASPRGPDWAVLYKSCWFCTTTLPLAGWALHIHRPILAMAMVVVVFTDQSMWYVDLAGYLVTGKFPIGAAEYLTWPQNAK